MILYTVVVCDSVFAPNNALSSRHTPHPTDCVGEFSEKRIRSGETRTREENTHNKTVIRPRNERNVNFSTGTRMRLKHRVNKLLQKRSRERRRIKPKTHNATENRNLLN